MGRRGGDVRRDELGVDWPIEHTMACDDDEPAEKFILQNHPPKFFFRRAEMLCMKKAFCQLHGELVEVPNDLNILIAGFVCKSVSHRNGKRSSNQHSVDEVRGETGHTCVHKNN